MSTNSVIDSYVLLRKAFAALWSAKAKDLELGHNQIFILYKLLQSESTMSELVELTMSDKASVTRTIAALVNQGFVRRKNDPIDGRVVRIELTAQGKAMAQRAKKIRSNIEKKLNAALTDEERMQFSGLTRKMIRNLEEEQA